MKSTQPSNKILVVNSELDNIIAVATDDSEPWVCMLAELIKTYPETGKPYYRYDANTGHLKTEFM